MSGLVCVGLATLDAVAVVSQRPAPDQRVLAEELVYSGGGPAATAAVASARLGSPVAFVGAVGDDGEGHRIVAALDDERVATTQLRIEAGRTTGASVVICEQDTASRTIYNRPTAPLALDEQAAELIRAADWVHVDHVGWPAVAAMLTGLDPGSRPNVSVDHGSPVAGSRPTLVDLYVPTIERLRADFGNRPVGKLLDECTAPRVVATLGDQGSVAREDDGTHLEAPGVSVPVVSTLGAGDVFHGALVTAISRGKAMSDAMMYANVAAALSCRAADGRSAIPSHDDVVHFLEASA